MRILLIFIFCITNICNIMLGQYYNTFDKYINANRNIAVYGGVYYISINGLDDVSFHNTNLVEGGFLVNSNYMVSNPQSGELLLFNVGKVEYDMELMEMTNNYQITFRNQYNMIIQDGLINYFKKNESISNLVSLIPTIDDDYKFLFFYYNNIDDSGDVFDLCYGTIDMNADDGYGAVISSGNILRKNVKKNYQRGVVPGNNCNLWMLIYDDVVDTLYTYEIRGDYINTNPITSYLKINNSSNITQYNNPVFKISPDRETLFMSATIEDPNSSNENKFSQEFFFWKFDVVTGRAYDRLNVKTNIKTATVPWLNYEFLEHNNVILSVNTRLDDFNYEYLIDLSVYDPFYIRDSIKRIENRSTNIDGKWTEYRKYNNYIYRLHPGITSIDSISGGYKTREGFLTQSSFDDVLAQQAPRILPFDEAAVMRELIIPESNSSFSTSLSNEIIYALPEGSVFTNIVEKKSHCFNAEPTLELSAYKDSDNFIWDDGSTSKTRTISAPGTYWVRYDQQCIKLVDTFKIKDAFLDIEVHDIDTLVCTQHYPVLIPNINKVDSVMYENNFYYDNIKVTGTTDDVMYLFNEGCAITANIKVQDEICPCDVLKHNAFTPNGDGVNDYFKPIVLGGCVPSHYILRIYNRYGQLVYASYSNNSEGWDGTFNGRPADQGVYFYTFEVQDNYFKKQYNYTGDITLLR